MTELDDVQIDQPVSPQGPGGRRSGPGGTSPLVWVIVALVVIGLGVGGYLYLGSRGPAEPPVEEVAPAPEALARPDGTPEAEGEAEEELELPPLDASDEVVRRIVQGLSEHPALASWLATDRLVRRFVVAVDNLAVGIAPRKQVPSMAPEEGFSATEGPGGALRPAPEAYERYDRLAAVVASIDAAGAVATYRRLGPVVEEAARELGYDAEGFDRRLERAILHLLEAPVPARPPELEPKVLSHHYADPRLEGLSDAQKQLLRTGPENQRLIQQALRAVARELGVPEERIPAERVIR